MRVVQGVLGMSWCPQDASFVLSTAKDNRTIVWDVASAEVYCELPPSSNWNFDVQVPRRKLIQLEGAAGGSVGGQARGGWRAAAMLPASFIRLFGHLA